MSRGPALWVVFLGWIFFGTGSVAQAQKVYWTNGGSANSAVLRANLDGSGAQTLITTAPHESRDIVLDLAAGKMYFVTVGDFSNDCRIRRANLDGTMMQNVVLTGSLIPGALAIDVAGGKIYWYENAATIRRANLDGTGAATIHTAANIDGLALDPEGGRLYWMINSGSNTTLRRANLDGTGAQDVLNVAGDFVAPSLAISGGKIYWARFIPDNALRSANLDGTGLQVSSSQFPELAFDISIDGNQNKVYWTQPGSNGFVRRANLDLSGMETVYSGTINAPPSALTLELPDEVPTLSGWMMMVLAGIMLWCGGTILGRQKPPSQFDEATPAA